MFPSTLEEKHLERQASGALGAELVGQATEQYNKFIIEGTPIEFIPPSLEDASRQGLDALRNTGVAAKNIAVDMLMTAGMASLPAGPS